MLVRMVQRLGVTAVVGIGSLGLAGSLAEMSATSAAALATCTDNWQGPSTGTTDWNASSANWSAGFPGSSSVVCIAEPGTYTVALTAGASINTLEVGGAVGAFPTVLVDGTAGSENLTFGAPSTIEAGGTLTLDPTSVGNVGINGGSGSLTVQSGGSFTTESTASNAFVQVPVTNQSGGTITIGATSTQFNNGTLTSNSGTFTVSSGGNADLSSGSSFTQAAGTLTVTGAFNENSGTFTASGGTESGNAVNLTGGNLADSATTGTFQATGTINLSGTIPVGQTLTGLGSSGSINLQLPGAVTDDGTLVLDPASVGNVGINGGSGSLIVASGGNLTTESAFSNAYIQVPVTNQAGGTVTVGATSTAFNNGTLTTNNGTFTVSSGGNANFSSGSSFTQAAGTLTVTGAFNENSGTFTASGGTESGNAVNLTGGNLADSATTGTFQATGTINLSGTIPVGQTLTGLGSSGSINLQLPGAVTDDGTLVLDPASVGNVGINGGSGSLIVASGGNLTTESTASNAFIQVPVTNQAGGTVTIGAASTPFNNGTVTTNSGTLQVVDGGHLTLSSGSTLVNTAVGTIGVTVNGTAGGISGPGTTLASGSTLSVTTVGSPSIGTVFTPIGGPVTGTFTNLSFGPAAYAVAYPAGAVQLTTEAPYTFTAAPLSAKENVSTGTVTLGNIGSASDGTGIYSATVNWGDGSGTGPATVNVIGATGTVTGSHTYTTPGTYTVTCSLANTDGTVITTSESVTVTGPVVTGFSKVSVTHGKKLTTKVSGTGLDASAVVTTSNPGVTVVSVKASKASRRHPNVTLTVKLAVAKTAALGPFNVTITETGGTTTVINAITIH